MASLAERSMGAGLKALNRIARLDAIDRIGLRGPIERTLFQAAKHGSRTAGRANRAFVAARRLTAPERLRPASRGDLFDLTPDDEQQMLQEAFGDFAAARVRPAAQEADAACATPAELLGQSAELGVTMLGVPEALGGAVGERSAVTTVLVAEALGHGDMGIALAALAPAGVATAIAHWGDAEQQARYLPAFVGEEVPAAALAVQEPRALFDPFALQTTARPIDGGYVLDGAKALVPRAADAELLVVAARIEDATAPRPALFLVESGSDGVFTEPEPAMGVRAAATGRLVLSGVRVEAGALLAGGDPAAYAEAVHRARLGWCALAIGAGQAVLDYAIPYVNERKAFGEPISNRQAVAFAVADIAIELDSMRLATYRAASRADRAEPFAREAALARVLCAQKGVQIGSAGVQLLGGHGYVKEHPVERWYRDLRATGVMEGALLV